MIKTLRLRNFKAFRDTGSLEIKPLTILAGANSAGKSSIFQSLLLLKQTLASDDLDAALELQGNLVKLGTFNELVFGKPTLAKSELSYDFEVGNRTDSPGYGSQSSPDRTGSPIRHHLLEEDSHIAIDFRFKGGRPRMTRLVASSEGGANLDARLKNSGIYDMRFSGARIGQLPPRLRQLIFARRSYERELPGRFQQFYRSGNLRATSEELRWDHFLPPDFAEDSNHSEFRLPTEITQSPMWTGLQALADNLRYETHYLGPLRVEPERVYLHGGSRDNIGPRGEGTIPVLFMNRSEPVFISDKSLKGVTESSLEQAVRDEFVELGLRQAPEVKSRHGLLYQMLFPFDSGRTTDRAKVTIADVGFGVSQILPIVVIGLRSSAWSNSLLLFEQPEIHLHPKLQANLGDFFLRLACSGRTVVVETHSEHMINRIRRRIAEDPDDKLGAMVNILFVRPGNDGNGSVVEPLTVNEFGLIDNWPEDFLPETADEAGAILNAALGKRRRGQIETSGP